MPTYALLVFLFTYFIIARQQLPWLSLDRPTGTLLGAALMVVGGVLTVEGALQAIDWRTIALLFGMLTLAGYFSAAGAFTALAARLRFFQARPVALLVALCVGSGALSALLLNDTVCLMLTPLLVALVRETGLPPKPYLFGLALSANVGGVVTFTGNPQNMIVGAKAGIPYASYFVEMLPLGVIGLALTALWLRIYFRAELQPRAAVALPETSPAVDWRLLYKSSAVMALVVAGFLLGYDLAGSAVLGAAILIAVASRPPRPLLEKLDWPLLIFFAGLFVVVQGVSASGLTGQVAASLVSFRDTPPMIGVPLFSLVSLLGSNLFSNVPFVLVVSESLSGLTETALLWKALAVSSTLAGNLTLVGSVANLIVFEGGREVARVSFWEYLRVGAPITLLTTALGALWIVAVHWLS